MAVNPPLPPESWADLRFFQSDWPALWQKLAAAPAWAPAPEQIFRALALTPRDKVRAVILGQDPYHTPGRAQGLAFSFPPEAPPRDSLKNILTELQSDLGITRHSGDLAAWADQGVLLLNTALTVPLGQANGHKTWGWSALVHEVLALCAKDSPKAFMLWGGPAQKLCAKLPREDDDGRRHLFVQSAHPSPLSCYRGFFGSRPFSQVNDWLKAQGSTPIDWGRES